MMPEQPDHPRPDPDLNATELTVLGQFLDFHRATLAMKCAGLDDADLKQRPIPPSSLSLLGLVRHLTEVEYGWFAEWLDGQPEKTFYYTADDPDGDFDNLDAHPVAEVWATYHACGGGVPPDRADLLRRRGDGPRRPGASAQPALGADSHGGGVRTTQRPRRPAAGGDRRLDRE